MNPEIVRLKGVSVDFEGNVVLEDVDLSINQKDFLGIIGPNGGGKTTLLRVLLGLVRPTRGEVRIFGQAPHHARNRIGYMPQLTQFDRGFPISVLDVVLMGRLPRRRIFRKYTTGDVDTALKALDLVDMVNARDRQIGQLSAGQRQRVLIARALVCQPKLLLLDEPTSSVDSQMKTSIYGLLEKLKKDMAIVLVTHDVGVIASHMDKIACLNGRLYYHDTTEISKETLQNVYQCPVDLIAHGVPHRVYKHHNGDHSHA